jgi:hypothetical protein
MIFTRPQWRSWLVRGAFIIVAYGLVLTVHVLASAASAARAPSIHRLLPLPGLLAASASAVYTAYLFAQAKARDLWQNPLLPVHLLVQTVAAGSAAIVPCAWWLEPPAVPPLLWVLGGSSLVHLLLVWGETTMPHADAHARLAAMEMTRGRYRRRFRAGAILMVAGVLAPWIGAVAVPLAMAGLLLYEHAYVQAGQSVPLA